MPRPVQDAHCHIPAQCMPVLFHCMRRPHKASVIKTADHIWRTGKMVQSRGHHSLVLPSEAPFQIQHRYMDSLWELHSGTGFKEGEQSGIWAHETGLLRAVATALRLRWTGYSRDTMWGFTSGPTAVQPRLA